MTKTLLAGYLALAPVHDPVPDPMVIEAALELYAAQRYTEAAAMLRTGYEASGSPGYLYPLAQSERRAGQCEQANTHYRRYLATDPPEADIEAAREGIAACEQVLSVLETATKRYDARHYAQAAAILREGLQASDSPGYLYPLAQSEREAGECDQAIEHYRAYLQTRPADADAAAAHEGIAACEQVLAQRDGATPIPPSAGAGEPGYGPIDTEPPPRRWYLDPAGDTLVAVGIVASGVGAGLLGVAVATRNGADGAGTEDDFAGIDRRQQNLTTAGVITLSVGATSLLAGVVRWAIVSRRGRRDR